MRLLRDSRGRPSWSHTLAVLASIAVTCWFLAGGVDVTVGQVHVLTATKSAMDYSLAVGVWLGFLAQREYVSKVSEPNARSTHGA